MTNEQALNNFAPPPELGRWQMRALIAGIAIIVLAALGAMLTAHGRGFFFSYLVGFVFWTGVAVGCLALTMLQFVARGAWGVTIRRVAESGARTLPLMALLFIPVALGMGQLFLWSHDEVMAHDAALQLKRAYLNKPFFLLRAVLYFAVWIALAFFINRWSSEQDRTGDHRFTNSLRNVSGPGIVLFALTVTLAATDWVMSLDAHWSSSIFGMMFMTAWGLSALAFIIVLLALLEAHAPLRGVLAPQHFHDLGTLLFALVMLYTYLAFSQFLIIWSGNLPEEIPWYLRRMTGGWQFVGLALVIFHFAVPFFLLLSRKIKRRVFTLNLIAALLLVMRAVDVFYMVAPEATRAHDTAAAHIGHFPGFIETLLYIALPIGIGGVWLAFFFWQLRRKPLLPPNDPLLERMLRHGHEGHH